VAVAVVAVVVVAGAAAVIAVVTAPVAIAAAGVLAVAAAFAGAVVVPVAAAAAAAAGVVVAAAVAAEGDFADEGVSVAGHWEMGYQGRPEQRQPAQGPCWRQVLQLCWALAPRQVVGLQGGRDTGAR
jgi:hypothetical protein